MQLIQLLRRAARENAAGGTIDAGARRCWPEVLARVERLAGGLRASGVGPGDRVAILGLNSAAYLESLFAVTLAGGVYVPLNHRLSVAELRDQIADSGATLLLADALGRHLLGPATTDLKTLSLDGTPGALHACTEELVEDGSPIVEGLGGGDDLAALYYTGGTTGRAKGVMLSHRNFVANAVSHLAAAGLGRHEVYLQAMPMFHVSASIAIYSYAAAAATLVLMPRFEAGAWLSLVEDAGVTRSGLAPTMLQMAIEHPDFRPERLTRLRHLSYGAAPMPQAILDRASEALPDLGFIQSYGQTEAAGLISRLDPADHVAERRASAGKVIPGLDVRIVDEAGRSLPSGAVGEICVRGDTVMRGYWGRPAETAAALRGGWLHTGDAGDLDNEGYLTIRDRVKDMIITGGENVFSGEVENALAAHPDVAECAVIGLPDDRWGERIHAVVRPTAGAQPAPETLNAHLAGRLARYKLPKSYEFRAAPLPVSAVGKVLKRELRAAWLGSAACDASAAARIAPVREPE